MIPCAASFYGLPTHTSCPALTELLPVTAQLVIPVAAPGEDQPQTVALPAYAGFAGNEKEELDNPHEFKAGHLLYTLSHLFYTLFTHVC
jgi:hypothetical protein